MVWHGGVEVGGWVVEGEMAILTDADHGDVKGALRHEGREAVALGEGVGGEAVEFMEGSRRGRQTLDETLPEKPAETRRVGRLEADVFIEVEDGDPLPWNRDHGCEFGEYLELG